MLKKVRYLTLQLTDEYEQTGTTHAAKAHFFLKMVYHFLLMKKMLRDITQHMVGAPSVEGYLRAHLNRIKPGDYVDLSAFIEMSA